MELTEEEKELLNVNRIQSFRIYHVRTLGAILQLFKEKKGKEAIEYLNNEIRNMKSISNKEFGQLIDALTLNLKLKEGSNDKANSSPRRE